MIHSQIKTTAYAKVKCREFTRINHMILCFFLPLIVAGFFTVLTSCSGTMAGEKTNASNQNTVSISPEKKRQIIEKADTTVVEMKSKGVELSYSLKEIRAKAGTTLLIRYTNESDMSHNIVLVKTEADIRRVGIAALQAVANEWIPENEMNRIIAYSTTAYSGETIEFSFKVPAPGTYPYICTYSAHWTQMQGRLISTE
ncbi:MAG: hypothetical protein JXQ96_05125 [Cyclobacteriaceae bacterium]